MRRNADESWPDCDVYSCLTVIPAKAGIQSKFASEGHNIVDVEPVGWDEIPAFSNSPMLGFHPSLHSRMARYQGAIVDAATVAAPFNTKSRDECPTWIG